MPAKGKGQTIELSDRGLRSSDRLPLSYFEELAQMGSLHEFLTNFMADEFQANIEFRKNMLYLMLDNAEGCESEIEYELLSDLHNALQRFLEKMHQCNHILH